MKKILLLIASVIISINAFAQVPAYVDTNKLLGWYPFNGNANNAYGTGLNGVVLGPVLTTDRFGNPNSAYHLDGILDHILLDTAFFNVGWSNFTISWWMNNDSLDNPNNFNNDQGVFETVPQNGLMVAYNWGHNNKYELLAGSDPGVNIWDILPGPLSNTSVTSHVWNHFVFEKQNDTVYNFYVNGVFDTSYTSSVIAPNYFCRLTLGNVDSTAIAGGEGVWGKLDDYGIWARALSSCEIRRLFLSSPYLFITSQPVSASAAISSTSIVNFSVTDTGAGISYQWQADTTSTGYVNLSNILPYSGVTTATLTITGVTASMNGNLYRCVVSGEALECTDTSAYAQLTAIPEGVDNVNNNTVISIAPNPTTGELSIHGTGSVDIKVYNIVGQVVKEASHTDNISIAEMPTGMYLIKLFDANGSLLYNGQVVKQ